MTSKFIFRQENRHNWKKIIHNVAVVLAGLKKDAEIEIKEIGKKRSGNQLKTYWVLIKVVKDWMNNLGNTFTDEDVSNYFKVKSGHCTHINECLVAKSISNRSDCSKEQMEALIITILKFGAENGIDGCEIEDRELKNLLEWYDKLS